MRLPQARHGLISTTVKKSGRKVLSFSKDFWTVGTVIESTYSGYLITTPNFIVMPQLLPRLNKGPQPAYSPDLDPCDYRAFHAIKRATGGQAYPTIDLL